MLKIESITQELVTEFFLNDPKLCITGLDDYDLFNLYEYKEYRFHPGSNYQGIYEDGKLIAVHKYESFTTICGNTHLYIASKFFRSTKTEDVYNFLIDYFREGPYSRIVVLTPIVCKHVIRFIKKLGFKQEGVMTNAIKWRQRTVDLLIFGKPILTEE